MIVKELIKELLDCDMNKEVSLQYPTDKGMYVNNYSRYEESEQFEIKEYEYGVVIGVDNEL